MVAKKSDKLNILRPMNKINKTQIKFILENDFQRFENSPRRKTFLR